MSNEKDIGKLLFTRPYRVQKVLGRNTAAVSHIPQFGYAITSLAGDAASPAGYVDVSAGDAHL
jgi:hypothetical protein